MSTFEDHDIDDEVIDQQYERPPVVTGWRPGTVSDVQTHDKDGQRLRSKNREAKMKVTFDLHDGGKVTGDYMNEGGGVDATTPMLAAIGIEKGSRLTKKLMIGKTAMVLIVSQKSEKNGREYPAIDIYNKETPGGVRPIAAGDVPF